MLFHQNAWVYNGGDCIWAALVNNLVDGVESTYGKEKFRAHLSGVDLWWLKWCSWWLRLFRRVFAIAIITLVVLFIEGTLQVPSEEEFTEWWEEIALGGTSVGAVLAFLTWAHVKAQAVWKALETPVSQQFFSAGDDPHFAAELGMMGRVK